MGAKGRILKNFETIFYSQTYFQPQSKFNCYMQSHSLGFFKEPVTMASYLIIAQLAYLKAHSI